MTIQIIHTVFLRELVEFKIAVLAIYCADQPQVGPTGEPRPGDV